MSNQIIENKLQALLIAYTNSLPMKLEAINTQWLDLCKQWDSQAFITFHRAVHSLCGSAGTYGYTALGQSARQVELYIKSLMSNRYLSVEEKQTITALLEHLHHTYQETVTPDTLAMLQSSSKIAATSHTIYLLSHNKVFINTCEKQLNELHYQVVPVSTQAQLMSVIKIRTPAAIIVDMDDMEDETVGALSLNPMDTSIPIPLFCMASNGDILTRLKAVRMGNTAFFQKPVDPFYLAQAIDERCNPEATQPYRIIIIDDTEALAEHFALTLQDAGMVTRYITNPLLVLTVIDEFQPDLLLMDIYMPDCNGLELATLLRQSEQYTHIPITFLSTEDDRIKQLSALNLGGDDFLTKPILPAHLVEAVKSRVKRAAMLNAFMVRDSLTGLLNHNTLLQRLDAELYLARRQSHPLAFVMIDVDRFKQVNDEYGHPVGDKILTSLSALLTKLLRRSDTIGRYGGDEFAIILPNTTPEQAHVICNKLREQFIHMHHVANNTTFSVTLSMGIAMYPEVHQLSALIDHADKALYRAKEQGRNQVSF